MTAQSPSITISLLLKDIERVVREHVHFLGHQPACCKCGKARYKKLGVWFRRHEDNCTGPKPVRRGPIALRALALRQEHLGMTLTNIAAEVGVTTRQPKKVYACPACGTPKRAGNTKRSVCLKCLVAQTPRITRPCGWCQAPVTRAASIFKRGKMAFCNRRHLGLWVAYNHGFPAHPENRLHPLLTHCKRGHPLEGDNLWVSPNGSHTRKCKACGRLRKQMRRLLAAQASEK